MRTNTQIGLAITTALLTLPVANALMVKEAEGEEVAIEYSMQSALLQDALDLLGDASEDPIGVLMPAAISPTCRVPTSPAQGTNGFYIRLLDVGGGFVAQLWKESNEIAGLQPRDHLCPDGSLYVKDTLVLAFDTTRPTAIL